MKRNSILASGAALALFATLLAQGCSSAEEEPETMMPPLMGQGGSGQAGAGMAGTGTAGTGGAAAGTGGTGTAGTGGASTAGTGGATAGAGGTGAAQGGSGGASAGAGGTGSAEPTTCVGSVSDNSACTVTCIDPCGVWNIGTRLCTCTANVADCASCGFANPNDPLIVPPTMALPGCVNAAGMPTGDDAMEDLANTAGYTCMENARCTPMGEPDRFCACRANDWDCDSKPDSFGTF